MSAMSQADRARVRPLPQPERQLPELCRGPLHFVHSLEASIVRRLRLKTKFPGRVSALNLPSRVLEVFASSAPLPPSGGDIGDDLVVVIAHDLRVMIDQRARRSARGQRQ